MLRPGWVAVAVRGPVAPAVGWTESDEEARASRVLSALGAAASHRSVIPAGAVRVASALMAAMCTRTVPATVVVIDGAGTAVEAVVVTEAAAASTGLAVSTPA